VSTFQLRNSSTEIDSSRDSCFEDVTLPLYRWCRGVFGCLAAADRETDQSQEHPRLSVCVWSEDFGTACVQSSPVPRANSEGMNCGCCFLFVELTVLLISQTVKSIAADESNSSQACNHVSYCTLAAWWLSYWRGLQALSSRMLLATHLSRLSHAYATCTLLQAIRRRPTAAAGIRLV